MGASPSSPTAGADEVSAPEFDIVLDANGNLTQVAGNQNAEIEVALRLEISGFLEGSPALRLMVDKGSAAGTAFVSFLDWSEQTFSCFFKLPPRYPRGGPGFLRALLALCKSETVYGITVINAGEGAVKKYLSGLKKAKRRGQQWSAPAQSYDCEVAWMKRSENTTNIHFKFKHSAEEIAIILAEEVNPEYQALTNSDPAKFIEAMTLPVRIWLKMLWWKTCYQDALENVDEAHTAISEESTSTSASSLARCGVNPQDERWASLIRECEKKATEKTAAAKAVVQQQTMNRLTARQKAINMKQQRAKELHEQSENLRVEMEGKMREREAARKLLERAIRELLENEMPVRSKKVAKRKQATTRRTGGSHEQQATETSESSSPRSGGSPGQDPSKLAVNEAAGTQATMSSGFPNSDKRDDWTALSDSCSPASFKTAQPILQPPTISHLSSLSSSSSSSSSSVFHTPTILPQDYISDSPEKAGLSSLENNNPPSRKIEPPVISDPGSAKLKSNLSTSKVIPIPTPEILTFDTRTAGKEPLHTIPADRNVWLSVSPEKSMPLTRFAAVLEASTILKEEAVSDTGVETSSPDTSSCVLSRAESAVSSTEGSLGRSDTDSEVARPLSGSSDEASRSSSESAHEVSGVDVESLPSNSDSSTSTNLSAEAPAALAECTFEEGSAYTEYPQSGSDSSTSTVKPPTRSSTSYARRGVKESITEDGGLQFDTDSSSSSVQTVPFQIATMADEQDPKSKISKAAKKAKKKRTKTVRKKKLQQKVRETEQGFSSQPLNTAYQLGVGERGQTREQESSGNLPQRPQASAATTPATPAGAASSSTKVGKGKRSASNIIVPILQDSSAAVEHQPTSHDDATSSDTQSVRYEQPGHAKTPNPSLCDSVSPVPETPSKEPSTPTAAASSELGSGESSLSTTPVTSLTHGPHTTPQSHTTAATSKTGSHGATQQSSSKPPGFWWDVMLVNFICAKAYCEKACNLWDGQSVVCPRCGPYSEVRYCSKEHLRVDVKTHWSYCGQWTFEHFCIQSSIPPDLLAGPPMIPCRNNWDSPERHRQALWFSTARREGDYFIFSDWTEQTQAGALPGDVDMRCSPRVTLTVRFEDAAEKDRFRRILAVCLFSAVEVQHLVDFMFRLLRDKLRSQGLWSVQLDANLRYQLRYELGVTVQPSTTGQRHACETEWTGFSNRHCRDPICVAERIPLLGDLGWGRGFRRLCEFMEASFWILRANRTTHPSVQDVKARTRGEGFEEVLSGERRAFRRGEGWDGAGTGMMEVEGLKGVPLW